MGDTVMRQPTDASPRIGVYRRAAHSVAMIAVWASTTAGSAAGFADTFCIQ